MKIKHWLILILALAAVLRLYGLSRGDTVNDEVFYGFRRSCRPDNAVGMDRSGNTRLDAYVVPRPSPACILDTASFDSRFWRKQFRAAVSVGDFGSFIRLYFISDRRENFFGARRASWSIFNGRDA